MYSVYKTFYYSKSRPRFYSFVAAIAVVLAFALASVCMLSLGERLYYIRMQNEALHKFQSEGNLETSISSPDALLSRRSDFIRWLQPELYDLLLGDLQDKRSLVTFFKGLSDKILSDRSEQALDSLARLRASRAQNRSMDFLLPTFWNDFLPQATAKLEKRQTLEVGANRIAKRLNRSESLLKQIRRRFEFVAKDVGELLDLTPQEVDPALDRLPYYSSGVLFELPKMQGLRDGIRDLDTLKRELDGLGAKVEASGENAREVFEKHILDYRNTTLSVLNEHREQLEIYKTELAKFNEFKDQIQTVNTTLEYTLKSTILEHLRSDDSNLNAVLRRFSE